MSISASNQLLAMLLLSFKAQRNGKVIKSTFDKHENHRTLYSHLLECVIWYRKLVSVNEANGEKLKNSKIITKIRLLTKSKTAQSEKKVGRSKKIAPKFTIHCFIKLNLLSISNMIDIIDAIFVTRRHFLS